MFYEMRCEHCLNLFDVDDEGDEEFIPELAQCPKCGNQEAIEICRYGGFYGNTIF